MADRDSQTVSQVCAAAGVKCRILNIWEIKEPMDEILRADAAGIDGHAPRARPLSLRIVRFWERSASWTTG
jgi:hypothetical protein